MKNIVENNVNSLVKEYKYSTLLTLIIFILFLFTGYSDFNIDYDVYVNEKQVQLTYGIYTKNNEHYIHIDDLTQVFSDYIYNDKISGKLIITTHDKLKKIEGGNEEYVIKVDNDKYCNLKMFMTEIGYDVVLSKDEIYILNNGYIQGKVLNNRTEIYNNEANGVVCFLDKDSQVNICINEKIQESSSKVVNVKVIKNEKNYYGYVLKKNIAYEYQGQHTQNNNKKVILVKADNTVQSSTDTDNIHMVAINMYRLSGVDTLTRLQYVNNVPKTIEIYATVNNGQKSSNYDSDILTNMLNSETNREKVITQLVKNVVNLSGVNLDFGNFKISDRENYTQFVKELAAVLHGNGKKLIVNIPSKQYIDLGQIIKYSDYVVLQEYSARTLASKTSGPISSINYVKSSLSNIISQKVDMNKVILEVPSYTILWTERRGTVINAEIYNMQAMKEYLAKNNIESKLDNITGQNYMNFTKGITTYKMWLEDEYSMIQKARLVDEYNLAGISIYKSGMELKTIYSNISKVLNKLEK